ncbi:biogenesis of lysosome-related organelles complex 1 subunit 4-like [Acanthaster planci]|uniref:Biogenesis of lysosome-related organelles complex 1 subunit 4-like n=1 Tax=Acanthaster planci TaxID=133434 RepID=A0A8B7ZLV7_ACAPL|nr:biogenesis of lysosome-related organelles complex 1 subunit 4-like [Acanthaster planci]
MADSVEVENKVGEREADRTATILQDTAKDYAEYVLVDPQREKQQLDEKIEEMLTRLDEFCAVVDMIRTDSSLSLNRSLPGIHAKAQEIRGIFQRIDRLEEFVSVVRDNVAAMEEEVNEVEREQGTLHSIKNLLSTLPVFTTKRSSGPKPPKKFTPLEIFKTSDYIKAEPDETPPVPEAKNGDT